MATGRTTKKYTRVFLEGNDYSGAARSIGPLDWQFETGTDNPLNASVVGTWMGQATISPGTYNGMFDNAAANDLHALLKNPSTDFNVSVNIGIQAVPAIGDPCFCGQFRQDEYLTTPGDTPVATTIKFSPNTSTSTSLLYAQPWGIILHADTPLINAATPLPSTDSGVDCGTDCIDTTYGGWMMYHIRYAAGAGNITATIKVQDSSTANDGDFADLLSTGVINLGAGGVFGGGASGAVALAPTATVKRYLRWQVVLGTATDLYLVLAFMRGYHR